MAKIKISVDGDLRELIPNYLKNRQTDLVNLSAALASKDSQTIYSISHRIVGNAGGFGFFDLQTYAENLEKLAKSEGEKEFHKMESIFREIKHYLENLEVDFHS